MREAMSRETACDLSPWLIAITEPCADRSAAAVTIYNIEDKRRQKRRRRKEDDEEEQERTDIYRKIRQQCKRFRICDR